MEIKRVEGKLELDFDGRYAHTCSVEEENRLRKILNTKLDKT